MTREPQTFIQSGITGGRNWLRENWHNTVIDVNQLPRQLRWLTVFGYGAVLVLLVVFLGLEAVGGTLPRLEFAVDGFNSSNEIEPGYTSYAAMLFFAVSTILGWGLLMTGASDCRRRVFLPVFFIYFSILIFIMTETRAASNLQQLFQFLDVITLFLILGFGILVAVTRQFSFWVRYPLVEFIGWSGLTAIHFGMTWLGAESPALMGESLVLTVSMLGVVAIPFWFLLGLDAIDAIKEYATFVTHRVQTWLSPRRLLWVVPVFIGIEAVLGLAFTSQRYELALGACLFAPILFVLILGAVVLRRWTPRAAVMIFWGGVVALLYGVIFTLGLQGSGIDEAMIEAANVLPPAALFTLLLLYDVMTFGTRAASVEGRIMPRSGRLLMYLGAVILTVGFTIFIFNLKHVETGQPAGGFQNFINNMTFSSLFIAGPFYILWSFRKNRHDLVLDATETPASAP